MPAAPPIDPLAHADWCERIARRAAREVRMAGPSTVDDLTQTGLVKVVELAPRFAPPPNHDGSPCSDPESAFRGWAYPWVRTAVRREAERLANGGTYRRRDPDRKPVRAVPLSCHRTPAGDPIELADPLTVGRAVQGADAPSCPMPTAAVAPPARPRKLTPAELRAVLLEALAAAGVPARVTADPGRLTVWADSPAVVAAARAAAVGSGVRLRFFDPAVFTA